MVVQGVVTIRELIAMRKSSPKFVLFRKYDFFDHFLQIRENVKKPKTRK
jgi:hypothetical protein